MPETTVVKRYTFEAAHQLPNHDGKCRDLHGHSYKVEVAVTGPVAPQDGRPDECMVLDFGAISEAFKERVFSRLDHKNLNDVLGPMVTTAENLAYWIFDQMAGALDEVDRVVAYVRVWETETGYAEYRP